MSNPRHNKPAGERERARRAVELRVAGHPYQAIAAELGYRDESGARKAVDRLLSRRADESVAELRTVEGRRLDELQRGVWDAAIGGDVGAVRAVLAVIERRSRLFGLDTPQRLAVGISESEFAQQTAELLKVTGPGPLLELARAAPVDGEVIAEDEESEPDGWSNIGGPDPAPPVSPPVVVTPVLDPKPEPLPEPQPVQSASSFDGRVPRRIGGPYDPLAAWRR